MGRSKATKIAVGAAVLALTVAAVPAPADDEVDVSLENEGGTRTLFVENLTGDPLGSVDFGSRHPDKPYRVRVLDEEFPFADAPFAVDTTMSHLYLVDGEGHDLDTEIRSDNLSVGFVTDVATLDLGVIVDPVFDLVADIEGDLCDALTALGIPCLIELDDVEGLPTSTDDLGIDPLDVADTLDGLPLVPAIPGPGGSFDTADFPGFTAGDDTDADFGAVPTSHTVLEGSEGVPDDLLAAMYAALEDLAATGGATAVIDEDVLLGALLEELGEDAFTLLATTEGLTGDTLLDDVVSELVADVDELLSEITSLIGAYLSFPFLSAEVPAETPVGTYEGIHTVTLIQG